MGIDQRRYHEDVIVPLRDHPGTAADDLVRQYAVDLAMSRQDLRDHLRQMRMLWNRRGGGRDRAAPVYARLASRDERLRAEHGERMFDPEWWHERAAKYEKDARGVSARLADDLRAAYGAVGRLTRAQRDAIARSNPGLSERGIDDALRAAGLTVDDAAVELPTGSGLRSTVYKQLREALGKLGMATIVPLLHPGRRSFRLLERGDVGLDRTVLDTRDREAHTLADSAATRDLKDALSVLKTALAQGADLHTLALYQIVDRLCAGRANGLPDAILVTTATDLGLDPAEARLVVANLPREAAPAPAAGAWIRDLVEDGQLVAARQAFAVLSRDDPDRAALHDLIEDRSGEVARLVRAADTALRQGREEEAASLLRQASRIAGDDEDVTRRLDRLPPPPPRDLVVRAQGGEVRLAWEPPTNGDGVRYRVLRADRPPASPGDGEVVGEGTDRVRSDTEPPAARRLYYAVFASTGGDWSRPVVAETTVVPPVGGVQIRVQGEEVVCAWRVHPAVERVLVRRTVGRPPVSGDDGVAVDAAPHGFVDASAPDGADVYYGIVAVYRDANRAEVRAPMAVARMAVRGDAPPFVARLRVHATALDAANALVHIAWTTPASGTVSVRRSGQPPPWPSGATVPADQVAAFGEPVVGDRLTRGPETTVESTVPGGQFHYVPFTVAAGGTAVVGEPSAVGVSEPVRDLKVRRAGTDLGVTWVWPPAVNLAEVTFTPAAGGEAVRRRLSRGQYTESGCRLSVGAAGGRVTVRGLTRGRGGGAETSGAPVSVDVDGTAVGVAYHLERTGGWRSRAGRLTVTVDERCRDVELLLVAARGPVLPVSPEGHHVLQRVSGLTLAPGAPWSAPFEVPRHLPRPYWLRCFVLKPAGVRVADPIDQMKVS